jgi:LSD1 subclass zinc finger protein
MQKTQSPLHFHRGAPRVRCAICGCAIYTRAGVWRTVNVFGAQMREWKCEQCCEKRQSAARHLKPSRMR